MKKRLWAILLTVCMLLSLVPAQVLAYVGPIRTSPEEAEQLRARTASAQYGVYGRVLILENEYITVLVDSGLTGAGQPDAPLTGSTRAMGGLTFLDLPTREYRQLLENYEGDEGTLANNLLLIYGDTISCRAQEGSFSGGASQVAEAGAPLEIRQISGRHDSDEEGPYIAVDLDFTDDRLDASVEFRLTRVKKGVHRGESRQEQITLAGDGEDGQHWGVFHRTQFRINKEYYLDHGHDQGLTPISCYTSTFSRKGHLTIDPTYIPLPRMAVDTVVGPKRQYYGYDFDHYEFSSIGIAGDMEASETRKGEEVEIPGKYGKWHRESYYSEIYTDGYACDNPFVALSDFYRNEPDWDNSVPGRVEGYGWGFFPTYVSTASGSRGTTVRAYGVGDRLYTTDVDVGRSGTYVCGLSGYRDMYRENDPEKPLQRDDVVVDKDAGLVGIFSFGQGYRALGAANEDRLRELQEHHGFGDPVAKIWGKSEKQSDGSYLFTDGAAELAPTVMASWDPNAGSLQITAQGTLLQNGVHLNAPTFKFYQPDRGGEGSLKLSYSPEGDLLITMDPDHNEAIFAMDIPKTSVQVNEGTVDPEGNLIFRGDIGFETLFEGAGLELLKLGYGLENGQFTMNGIHAKGFIDTAKLAGLDLANIAAEVNTFAGEEVYDFAVELNAFELFHTQAELTLMRHMKTGQLLPDKLFFALGTEVGVPLVPPAPIGELNGGGLGFEGLADTCNGDYMAIPPIKLHGMVEGTYLQMIEGQGHIWIGPGTLRLTGSDLNLVNAPESVQFLDAYTLGLELAGEEREYLGQKYKGLRLAGDKSISAVFPNKELDLISGTSLIKISGFGGTNADRTSLYFHVGGDATGTCTLQTPGSWPEPLSNLSLANVDLNGTAGVCTAIPIRGVTLEEGVRKALKDMDFYVGISARGGVLGSEARVWVILPDLAEGVIALDVPSSSWGFEYAIAASLGEFDWEAKLENRKSRQDHAPAAAETDRAVPRKVTVSRVEAGESAYLQLVLDQAVTEEQIRRELKITKGTGPMTLKWFEKDAQGRPTDPDANCMSALVDKTDGTGKKRVVLVYLGKGTDAQQTYTIDGGTLSLEDVKSANVQPYEKLDLNFAGDSLSGRVVYPRAGKQYRLRTYLGTEQGSADYMVDEREITDPSAIALTLPREGGMAPTGTYYVTSYLLEEKTGDFDKDQPGMETAWVAVDSAGSRTAEFSYTNPSQPAAPRDVTLQAMGNEIMRATWKAPEAGGVNGYKLRILNGDGTQTELGYEYTLADFSDTPGLTWDEKTGTYSVDMALTAGGIPGTDGRFDSLQAGKAYRISVSAFRQETLDRNEKDKQPLRYYSAEQTSSAVDLPAYREAKISVELDGQPLVQDPKTHIFQGQVTGEYPYLDILQNAGTVSLIRMDTGEEVSLFENSSCDVPEFTGSLMLQITVAADHDGVTDHTVRYVKLERPEIAPILVLDQQTVYPDGQGNYTITGHTSAGARVLPVTENYDSAPAEADENGAFALTGTLPADGSSMVLTLVAENRYGRRSAIRECVVTRAPSQYTLTLDACGGTPAGSTVLTEDYRVPALPVPTRPGFAFAGWFTRKTGGQPVKSGIRVSDDMTLYARWTAGTYQVEFLPNGGTPSQAPAQDFTYGQAQALRKNMFTRAGYTFSGWNTQAQGKGTAYTDGQTVKNLTDKDGAVVKLYAQWNPGTGTAYTVKHLLQELDGSYTLADTQTLKGTTQTMTRAKAGTYPGFTALPITQSRIAGSGSTVVEIRYDRNIHTLTWDLQGGTASGSWTRGEVAYGTPITPPAVRKDGYVFDGWEPVPAETMPDRDLTYRAQWTRTAHNHKLVKVPGQAPTFREDGWKDSYKCSCGKRFEDPGAAREIPDFAAWKRGPGRLEKLRYQITEGDRSIWKLGSRGSVTLRSNGLLQDFTSLELDGKTVEPGSYKTASGSTVLTLGEDFLNALEPGSHTLTLRFRYGMCAATLTVQPADPKPAEPVTPSTGDGAALGLWTLLCMGSLGAAALMACRKKQHP